MPGRSGGGNSENTWPDVNGLSAVEPLRNIAEYLDPYLAEDAVSLEYLPDNDITGVPAGTYHGWTALVLADSGGTLTQARLFPG